MAALLFGTLTFQALAQKTVLDVWRWGELFVFNTESLGELERRFEALYPDIDVQVTEIPGGVDGLYNKILVAVASAAPPDAAFVNRTQILQLANEGALTPLDSYFSSGLREHFIPWAWDTGNFKGVQYGIPFTTDVRGLWWNKSVFEGAGLSGDTGPASLEELEEFTRKLTRTGSDGQITQLGFGPWLGNWNLVGWFWAFGGSIYNPETMRPTINSPENVAALDWVHSFAQAYPPSSLSAEVTRGGGRDGFVNGYLAMLPHIHSFWRTATQENPDIVLGAGEVPHARGGTNGTWAGGPGLVVPRGAKHVDQAVKYIEFMTSRDGQSFYYESLGHLPTVIESIHAALEVAPPNERAFLQQLPNAHPRTPLWRNIQQATSPTPLINGEISPKAFAEKVQLELERAFAETFPDQ